MVHRNLGWAYYRQRNDLARAIDSYEQAIACDQRDPRLFVELDTLYEFSNVAPSRRLAMLAAHHAVLAQRQDSLLRLIMVLVLNGQHDQAIAALTNNRFHAKEGSEGIHDVYVDAHLLCGLDHLRAKRFEQALGHFSQAAQYPENLSVGRPQNDPRAAQVGYLAALAQEKLERFEAAKKKYLEVVEQAGTDDWPEARFYQAQCWERLDDKNKAAAIYASLVAAGERRLKEDTSTDFFAKFGEQETAKTRTAAAHFLLGLGRFGQGELNEAREQFRQAVKLNSSHVWAEYWRQELDR
jgi:tetratricopeptide (TPR) repeat protein